MNRLLLCLLLALPLAARGQNPIISGQFTADPTARVFGGRVWLFPSHDVVSPNEPERKWFAMGDYHAFCSSDLVDWSDRGVILSQADVPWGDAEGFSMWAPDCVEHGGKYYFFFPDAPKPVGDAQRRGFNIGVAIADNLFAPRFRPEPQPLAGVMGIDPCVLQTTGGEAYLFWGGGGLVVAKLAPDLLSIEGKPQRIEGLPDGFKEGPFAFERDGKYYLTYPWVRTEGGTECLAYAMADKPMGPYIYKGVIMDESPTGCWTNHHSIVEFGGQWYLFYHHNDYSPKFDKLRSTRIDSLRFRADGTIEKVVPTLRGVGLSDSRRPVQLDRYSAIGGGADIAFNDTADTFKGWHTRFPAAGAWVAYGNVDVKGTGNVCLRVRTNAPSAFTLAIGDHTAKLSIPDTKGRWESIDTPVSGVAEGIAQLRLTLDSGAGAEVDWLSITDEPRERYFAEPTKPAPVEADGFLRQWTVYGPEAMPIHTNAIFTDSYVEANCTNSGVGEGRQVRSTRWNVKLFRYADMLAGPVYGVRFHVSATIDCPEALADVRLAIGSNSASRWWVDGKEAVALSGDRRMVEDDAASPRLALAKGRHTIEGTIINGPGMSDFCARLIDAKGRPVANIKN